MDVVLGQPSTNAEPTESPMNTSKTIEAIDHNRRRLLGMAAMGITVAGAGSLLPSQLAAAPAGDTIRPFRVHVPEEQLADLRRRITATRWPDQETVDDGSQGPQLAKFQEVIRYWVTSYDWRKVEARLNALPMFLTEIDGVDIHFIHVRSKHENALPLIVVGRARSSSSSRSSILSPIPRRMAETRRTLSIS